MANKQLAGFSDGEVGEVDMFGLDEFGVPVGTNPLWGAVIGGGIGTVAAIATRKIAGHSHKLHHWAEGVGFLAAGVAGGAMIAFPQTRQMGWAAVATAFMTNGLRQLEHVAFPAKMHAHEAARIQHHAAMSPDGKAAVASAAEPAALPSHAAPGGFGIHAIEAGYPVPAGYVAPGGFGAAVIDAAYPVPGSVHQSGQGFSGYGDSPVGPPTLLDAGDYGLSNNPAVQQNTLLGGPSLSALGAHFGSTLFSQN